MKTFDTPWWARDILARSWAAFWHGSRAQNSRRCWTPKTPFAVAGELGCAVETDLDALCARADVDAVIVATPNYLHKEPVLAAARQKKHVFCEKPIALCYRDCDAMVKAAQESGVVLWPGM